MVNVVNRGFYGSQRFFMGEMGIMCIILDEIEEEASFIQICSFYVQIFEALSPYFIGKLESESRRPFTASMDAS